MSDILDGSGKLYRFCYADKCDEKKEQFYVLSVFGLDVERKFYRPIYDVCNFKMLQLYKYKLDENVLAEMRKLAIRMDFKVEGKKLVSKNWYAEIDKKTEVDKKNEWLKNYFYMLIQALNSIFY